MKRAELQKGAVYFHKSGQWRTGEYVLVLETEPWVESYRSWGYRSPDFEPFKPFTGSYGQSRNGVLVAETSTYGKGISNKTWRPRIVQLRNIQKLVCPADGDLAATLVRLDREERERKAAENKAEEVRAARYNAMKERAHRVVRDAGLEPVEGWTTSDWVSPTMGKVKVHRDGSFATVQLRISDLEKLLAQLSDRDKDLYQYEQI